MKNHAIMHRTEHHYDDVLDPDTGGLIGISLNHITREASCIACGWTFSSDDAAEVDREALRHAETED
jgi:hypothetical protein